MSATAASLAIGSILSVVGLAALVGNVLLLVVFGRSRRLHTSSPTTCLIANVAVVHVLAVLLCNVPTIAAALSGVWAMGQAMCLVQTFFRTLALLLQAHTLSVLAFERYLRICRPLKHEEVFSGTVVIIILTGLWFCDTIIALNPFYGWGKILFDQDGYTCDLDWVKSESLLIFTTLVALVVPMAASAACYIAILGRKVLRLRKRVSPASTTEDESPSQNQEEEQGNNNQETYAEKLRRQEYRLQKLLQTHEMGSKPVAEKLPQEVKRRTREGQSESDSEFEDLPPPRTEIEHSRREAELRAWKMRYRPREVALAKTTLLLGVAFLICWLPYFVVTYVESYALVSTTAGTLIALVLVHLSTAVNPYICVVHSHKYKRHCRRTLSCRRAL
ncbi:PREDICTED: opsin-3-like [Branchiostoma belcheri]|uniref:Opsin-3-like n=1 Tax=Branchiostoma belcheri TaxID=7741 RepID=A0A6P4Z8G5_BRABE|nr:PREDICTED: opsin-3-like [Branchiostoma belcheri]